jgi:hypothetical protein
MPAGGEELASNDELLSIEREVLRAVCRSITPRGEGLSEADIRRLESYRFHDYTHQVIFDTLCELRALAASNPRVAREPIQERLAQRLTRKGFPEVELEALFVSSNVTLEEIRGMILRLAAADAGAANRDER